MITHSDYTNEVYGGTVKSYNFDAIRTLPGVRSAIQLPIPDPALTRGRPKLGALELRRHP